MDALLPVLGMFGLTVIVHVLVYLALQAFHIRTMMMHSVFFVGLCVFVVVILPAIQTFPVSAVAAYSILSLVYILMTISPYLGDMSPTAKIVEHIKHHDAATKGQIISLFDEDELTHKRLQGLMNAGYIYENQERIIILPKGRVFVRLLELFHRIIGVSHVG